MSYFFTGQIETSTVEMIMLVSALKKMPTEKYIMLLTIPVLHLLRLVVVIHVLMW